MLRLVFHKSLRTWGDNSSTHICQCECGIFRPSSSCTDATHSLTQKCLYLLASFLRNPYSNIHLMKINVTMLIFQRTCLRILSSDFFVVTIDFTFFEITNIWKSMLSCVEEENGVMTIYIGNIKMTSSMCSLLFRSAYNLTQKLHSLLGVVVMNILFRPKRSINPSQTDAFLHLVMPQLYDQEICILLWWT
jgi:hypothetical protein